MEQQLIDLKKYFEGRTFNYSDDMIKKAYVCHDVDYMGGNFKISCKKRTFVVKPYDVESFISKINFITEKKKEMQTPDVEVMPAQKNIDVISNKLFQMFEKVSENNVAKEDLEKAKVMIGISNQIISIEKVKYAVQALSLRQ